MSVRFLLLPLIASLVLPGAAWAQQARDDDNAPRARASDLSDSVRRVERRTRGEVLSAEQVQFDGRDVHRVKVLEASGRVRVHMEDPRPRRDPRTRDDDD